MQRDLLRHVTAYMVTALVYAGLFFAFFYFQTHTFVADKPSKEKTIQMSLSTFVPPQEEAVKEHVLKPVAPPQPIKQEQTPKVPTPPLVSLKPKKAVTEKPLLEPKVQKKSTPKPVVASKKVKPKVQKEPQKPKLKKNIVKKVQKKAQKKVVQRQKQTKPARKRKETHKQTSASKRSKSSAAERNRFWSLLRQRIERNKSYPRIAKKRGMEGTLKVRFTILSSGKVGHISLSGPKVFHNSARKAVQKAFPLNPQKVPLSLPTTVNLTLHYQIH